MTNMCLHEQKIYSLYKHLRAHTTNFEMYGKLA